MLIRILLSLALSLAAFAETRNLILVTADGLRWQELFTGMDPLLANEKSAGTEGKTALREKFWRDTPEQRRAALMPFFWTTLAPRAVVHEDVRVTNGFRVSYPGYSEILTGRAQDGVIQGNDHIQNPTETLLEFLRRKLKLSRQEVAMFGSWDTFRWIVEKTPGSVTINTGYMNSAETSRIAELSRVQRDILSPWDAVRYDYFAFEMAMDYLTKVKPRVLYIAFGETDDWAHNRRYDRVLESTAYFDRSLERLFKTLNSMPNYRNNTAVVITSDHGRGSKLEDWSSHGSKVEGADRIWAVISGPDQNRAGPIKTQSGIAPAILRMMGLSPEEFLRTRP